jgi:hypothetical protein
VRAERESPADEKHTSGVKSPFPEGRRIAFAHQPSLGSGAGYYLQMGLRFCKEPFEGWLRAVLCSGIREQKAAILVFSTE